MKTVSISAHFDGEHILLDEPFHLEPNTKLLVTILPKEDVEHESWMELSGERLQEASGVDEEGYSLDLIKEENPEYEGR